MKNATERTENAGADDDEDTKGAEAADGGGWGGITRQGRGDGGRQRLRATGSVPFLSPTERLVELNRKRQARHRDIGGQAWTHAGMCRMVAQRPTRDQIPGGMSKRSIAIVPGTLWGSSRRSETGRRGSRRRPDDGISILVAHPFRTPRLGLRTWRTLHGHKHSPGAATTNRGEGLERPMDGWIRR